jgi:ankyrin repeat protein
MMFTLTPFLRLLTICFALFTGAHSNAWAQNDQNLTVNAQLLVAARQADAEGVKKSLDRGAAPNSRNRSGKTTLFLAIEKNRLDIVHIMINAGGDVNLPSLEKVTPLIAASYAGNADIVQLLIASTPQEDAHAAVASTHLVAPVAVSADTTAQCIRTEDLDGPVVSTDGRSDVVTDQAQVDNLLESLGF